MRSTCSRPASRGHRDGRSESARHGNHRRARARAARPYAGAVGYVAGAHQPRYRHHDPQRVVRRTACGAGRAGIVADSDPAREFRETEDKAQAVLKALALAKAGGEVYSALVFKLLSTTGEQSIDLQPGRIVVVGAPSPATSRSTTHHLPPARRGLPRRRRREGQGRRLLERHLPERRPHHRGTRHRKRRHHLWQSRVPVKEVSAPRPGRRSCRRCPPSSRERNRGGTIVRQLP